MESDDVRVVDDEESLVTELTEDESEASIFSESEEAAIQNQVVARSNIGTAFYLFNHQAGGHKPFLRSAYGEVCKPAIPLELQFYQHLETRHPQLKTFVPPFVGVITVDLHPVTLTQPSDVGQTATSEEATTTTIVEQHLGSIQLKPPLAAPPSVTAGKKRRLVRETSSPSAEDSPPRTPPHTLTSTASYSAKLWRKERQGSLTKKAQRASTTGGSTGGLHRTNSFGSSREYLVLGDLTQKYSRPCVVDIKMGTRQHGEDAPPAKVKSHSAKCAGTTSFSLGLRICGMQIYDEIEQRYTLWDKHWGRQLKDADIEPALTTYMSNGSGPHWESLEALLAKLQQLETVISQTTGLRFWGSSLLLIYEGDLRNAPRREDVHLIDFAHCQMSDDLVTSDDGLLLGLRNMAKFLGNILAKRPPSHGTSTATSLS